MTTGAEALHMQNGNQHIVGVKSLRVLLSKDDGAWFAQGLEIDYASAGETVYQVKKNFEDGLEKTIAEHLKLHGTIERLLKPAPADAWNEFYSTKSTIHKQKFTTVQFHDLEESVVPSQSDPFPFEEIEFLEPLAA
jgi:hypothetical protein